MASSFTTFSADIVFSDNENHILIAHTCPEFPHKPKISVLTARCEAVMEERHIEALPSALAHASTTTKSQFTGRPMKGKKGKGTKTVQEEIKDERPLEGSVTCL